MMCIRVGNNRVLSIDIKAFDVAFDRCREYLCCMKSRIRVQLGVPCFFKFGNYFRVGYFLISREVSRRCTHIAGSLYVVLTTERVDTTALTAKFTNQKCHIGHGHNALCTGGMLGYTKTVDDRSLVGFCVHDRSFS